MLEYPIRTIETHVNALGMDLEDDLWFIMSQIQKHNPSECFFIDTMPGTIDFNGQIQFTGGGLHQEILDRVIQGEVDDHNCETGYYYIEHMYNNKMYAITIKWLPMRGYFDYLSIEEIL